MRSDTPTAEKWVQNFNEVLQREDHSAGYNLHINNSYELVLTLNNKVVATLGPQTGEVMTMGLRSCSLLTHSEKVNAHIIYELLTRGREILECIKWELEERK